MDRGGDRGTGWVYTIGGGGVGGKGSRLGESSKVGCIYIDCYEENHGTYDRVKLRSK